MCQTPKILLRVTFDREMSLLERYGRLKLPTKKKSIFQGKILQVWGNSSTRVSILVISPSTNLGIGCNIVVRWLRYRATTSKVGKTTNSLVIPSKK